MSEQIQFSEIFRSIQGEGLYTGQPTLWLRFYKCNLTCMGFSQPDPADPSTYDREYENIDTSGIEKLEDLPVFTKGCDSSYSWAKKFEHLQHEEQADAITEHLAELLPVYDEWVNHRYDFHMCFTGGEPLLKKNQKGTAAILDSWIRRDEQALEQDKPFAAPTHMTFETNGTQEFTQELKDAFYRYAMHMRQNRGVDSEVLMSYSPKLFHVSGEPANKAIKPEKMVNNVQRVMECGLLPNVTFKFVLTEDQRAWNELEQVIGKINDHTATDIRRSVWIMPEGSQAYTDGSEGRIAQEAIARGYKVAARVQNYLFFNQLGT